MSNPPRLLTRRPLIQSVAARWRQQYYRSGAWGGYTGDARLIYEKLSALNLDSATRQEVDDIIGNSSWTVIQCGGCQRDVEVAAEVGELPDWESATVILCAECIALAGKVVRAVARPLRKSIKRC